MLVMHAQCQISPSPPIVELREWRWTSHARTIDSYRFKMILRRDRPPLALSSILCFHLVRHELSAVAETWADRYRSKRRDSGVEEEPGTSIDMETKKKIGGPRQPVLFRMPLLVAADR